MGDLRDDPGRSRYELATDEGPAIAAYRRDGDVVVFVHTEVPPDEQGHGLASRLVHGALADVRRRGLKVQATCPFVAAYLRQHPEEQDLLA